MPIDRRPRKWLGKKSKGAARAFPLGTVAFYGPDDRRATKVAVAVFNAEGEEAAELHRWFAEAGDLRDDRDVLTAVTAFSKGAACGLWR